MDPMNSSPSFLLASPRRFQYSSLASLVHVTLLLLLGNSGPALSQGFTNFQFQNFNVTDADLAEFLIRGDAAAVPNASAVSLNLKSQGPSCGSLMYANPVQFRYWSPTVAMPAVASFETSFTFAISGQNSGGFSFLLSPTNSTSGSGAAMCLVETLHNGDPNNHILAVEFDTWRDPEFGDPSDNHVGVDVNSMNSTATFNFCGDGEEKCSYFVRGRDLTAWVDYDSSQRTLEVRLAEGNGSLKPAEAQIRVAELDISNVVKDVMWVGFSGSQSVYPEVHQIKAWKFATGPFEVGSSRDLHFGMSKVVALAIGIAAACVGLTAVAVVVHRVLHGKWGCISCDFADVRVTPAKLDAPLAESGMKSVTIPSTTQWLNRLEPENGG